MMNFQTLMQAGPARANELFGRLSETTDGAVKTRERLFAELKAELELHAGLEEQHLFPILRKDAETRELVADAVKDNRELRAKLAELDALPKGDATFPERLSELQKTFRQHARDEKKELLPAVRRALSAEQVEAVAGRIEAGLAEAEQAKQDEAEERRAKARQEREQAERQAAQQQAARDAAEMVARTATAAGEGIHRATQTAIDDTRRIGAAAADIYADAARVGTEVGTRNLQAVAGFPDAAIGGLAEIQSAWLGWLGETTSAGTQMLHQVAQRQREFAAEAVRGWLEHNARVLQVTLRVAGEGLRARDGRIGGGSGDRRADR